MKAKFVYEAFKEDSDPISDIGIGGIKFNLIHNKLEKEITKKWINILKKNLEGNTIEAMVMPWESDRHEWKKTVIKVDKVLNKPNREGFSYEINIKDIYDKTYTIAISQKVYIK